MDTDETKPPILDFSRLRPQGRPGEPRPPTKAEFEAMRPGDPVMLATVRPGTCYRSPYGVYFMVVRDLPKGGKRVVALVHGMESTILNPQYEVVPMIPPAPAPVAE